MSNVTKFESKSASAQTLTPQISSNRTGVVRRHVTSKPRTEAGEEIYKLALNLTRIKDVEEARNWFVELHNFNNKYRSYMDEKTRSIYTRKEEFTHGVARKSWTRS